MGSTTTNSNVSSYEFRSVLDELHCDSFRPLVYNEWSRIVSGLRKAFDNLAYVEPLATKACFGVDRCLARV